MGNNAAYGQWEHTVIELKKAGVLTTEILDVISRYHEGTDIDSGGSADLTVDGQDVQQIVVLLFKPDFKPQFDPDDLENFEEWEIASEQWFDEFYEISRKRWGWN